MKSRSSLFILICFVCVPLLTFAQTSSSTPKIINARILPIIWYSTLSINDGDSIKIYSGIQNNSGVDFSGSAIFYVDDIEISKKVFLSNNNSLIDVSTDWVASPGSHDVQVKISASVSADKALVSYESSKENISIVRKINAEIIKESALSTISLVVAKTDKLTATMADNIESYKKPIPSANSDRTITNSKNKTTKTNTVSSVIPKGKVLGVSTTTISGNESNDKSLSWYNYLLNYFLDALAFLVRNWLGSLAGIIILFLGWRIKRWGDK